jgi:large subunit ribosomal protein L23
METPTFEKIILHPLSTEKSLRLMESENKLVFVVERTAKKAEIKKAIEQMFNAKVVCVNTLIRNGKKRAYIQFSQETPAIDIATNLGLM